jgi:hypothetical protein
MMNKVITELYSYLLLCMDCANHLILDDRVLVRRNEFERLQRLDKRVMWAISEYNRLLSEYGKGDTVNNYLDVAIKELAR